MRLSFWLNLVGLLLGVVGTVYTAASPLMTEQQASEIGVSRWAGETSTENVQLPIVRELLDQSRRARCGLSAIALGFVLQAGALLVDARRRGTGADITARPVVPAPSPAPNTPTPQV